MNHSYRKIKGVCKKQKSTGVEFTATMSSYTIQDIKHVITNPHETARYGEIASAILNFFVCCMEMG